MILRFKILSSSIVAIGLALSASTQATGQKPPAPAKVLGNVTAIQDDVLSISSDSGVATRVQVQDSTQIVRAAPGQTDLKAATPITLKDLQVGDRVFARLAAALGSTPAIATALIVMKKSDIAEKQQHDISQWQEHGAGGLVTAIDVASGNVTISSAGFGAAREINVHVLPSTIVRRYAHGSIKFDDAQPAKLEELKRGDQLRARGARSPDGLAITADEIVFGAFRNLAGPITAVDAAHSTLELQDLLSKKKVTIQVSPDSQLRKLPQMMAERIGARLKSGPAAPSQDPASTPEAAPGRGRFGAGGGGRADFQQMLDRVPPIALADLQKGDVILMVATQDQVGADSAPVAITLVSGVEPILAAAPDVNRAATLLSPWNLGGGGAADAGGGLP